jgi:hypothetical protein
MANAPPALACARMRAWLQGLHDSARIRQEIDAFCTSLDIPEKEL